MDRRADRLVRPLTPEPRGLLRALALWPWVLGLVQLASPAAAQWPFDPAGYLYSTQARALGVEHVMIPPRLDDPQLAPAGVMTRQGVLHRFASLSDTSVDAHGNVHLTLDFMTFAVDGVTYTFLGEYRNSHVYEQDVTNPREVVAAGKLSLYRYGRLLRTASVKWTYLPKRREAMADVNAPYPSGRTDLMYAALHADLPTMRTLVARGADVEMVSDAGETALLCVLDRDGPSLVQELDALIAAGADVNRRTRYYSTETTPLLYAVGGVDDSLGAVQRLLAAGADVNAVDEFGRTALVLVLDFSDPAKCEIVKALLGAGADVNARDPEGRTALSIARARHNAEAVVLLLAAGAR